MQKLDPERYVLLNIEAKGQFARFAVPRSWSAGYVARFAWEHMVAPSAMNEHFTLEMWDERRLPPEHMIGRTMIDEQLVKVVAHRLEE